MIYPLAGQWLSCLADIEAKGRGEFKEKKKRIKRERGRIADVKKKAVMKEMLQLKGERKGEEEQGVKERERPRNRKMRIM